MSDTTGTTVPTWLAKAEAAHQNDERERIARNIEEARQLADAVNNRLTKLDIEPITEAHADAQGIIPAHLVAADPANQLHGIYAIWDEDEFEPRLLIDDYDDTRHTGELQLGRLLSSPADVVRARREGPATFPAPSQAVQHMTLRNAAMRGVNAIPGDDTSYDADHVAAAINSLTAAVLYLAHTVTKINNES